MESYTTIFRDTNAIILMILFFGGSIFVHELGHFVVAKWRGLKVTRFSIGFGPRIFTRKGKDGCEYSISLLPFGGYVALPQLSDMREIEGGSDDHFENLPKVSYFDKVSVAFAGAFFNLLFALVLAVIVYFIGVPTSTSNKTNIVGFVPEDTILQTNNPNTLPHNIKAGDKILKVDDATVSDFSDIFEKVALGSGRYEDGSPQVKLTIERNGVVFNTTAKPSLIKTNSRTGDEIRMLALYPKINLRISNIRENSPAKQAGFKVGDEIISIDGIKLFSNLQMSEYMKNLDDGKSAKILVLRNKNELELEVSPIELIITRPLCNIILPDQKIISFMNATTKDDDAVSTTAQGTLKVLSIPDDLQNISIGDLLIKANGKDISTLTQLNTIINHFSPDKSLKLLLSNGYNSKDFIVPQNSSSQLINGITKKMIGCEFLDEKIIVHPTVYAQFKENLLRTWNSISSLINPKSDIGLKHLSGPVGIGRAIYKFSLLDFSLLLSFIVLININLAILNLLPIPVLDGGHILIATISKIIRREIPPNIVATLQGTFIILFLTMMVYVVYFDVLRWSGDNQTKSTNSSTHEFYLKEPIIKK